MHTHCGCCSQCLDRRFAILAADAAEHDPVEMYRVELLAGARDRPNAQTMAESYVRTALELREMGELAFFGQFGGETARVCGGFPSLTADEVGQQVLDLHQRHGQAVGKALKAGIERHSAELVNRNIPPSSVLMMTVVPGGAPALAPVEGATQSSRRGLRKQRPRAHPATSAVTHMFWIRCRHGCTSLHVEVAVRANRRLNALAARSASFIPKACPGRL